MKKYRSKIKKKPIIIGSVCLALVFIIFLCGYIYSINTKNEIQTKADRYFRKIETKKDFGKKKEEVKYSGETASVIRYPKLGVTKLDKEIKKSAAKIENTFFDTYKKDSFSFGKIKYYSFIDYDTIYGVDDIIGIVLHQYVLEKNTLKEEKRYIYSYSLEETSALKDSYIFTEGYQEAINNYLKESHKEEKIDQKEKFDYVVTQEGIQVYLDKEKTEIIPFDKIKNVLSIDTTKKTTKIKDKTKEGNESFKTENKNAYTTQKVNVYLQNDQNGQVRTTLNKGEEVKETAVGNKKFAKIKYGEEEGYILTSKLSEKVIVKEGYESVNDSILVIKGARAYKQDNEKAKVLLTTDKIKSFTRIGKSKDWNEVLYENEIAFIRNQDIAKEEQGKTTLRIKNRNIDPNKPMVALTFDDGPNPSSTTRIINTLEKYNSVATFFDLASLVEAYPKVAQREEKIGCEVGTHTYSHPNLATLSKAGIESEMNKSTAVFKKVLGHDQVLVRPPYGSTNKLVRETVKYPMISWDIDTLDWKSRNKNSILQEVHKFSDYDGRIILMHSIYETTADAVEVLVPELINKGYQLVTVSELAKYKGNDYLKNGNVYYSFH